MNPIKHIIFDFDGTLANTLPVLLHASQQIFSKYDGRDITPDDFRRMLGPTEPVIIARNLRNRAQADEAVEAFIKAYEEAHERMAPPLPEIVQLLKEMKAAGLGLALFTGKSRQTLTISLAKLNWPISFDYIVTGDDVREPKPSPEGLEQILKAMNWTREETIFVGDSNDDQLAGESAGIRTLAAGWMPMKQDSQAHIPPERIFTDLERFKAYVRQHLAQ